MSDVNKGEEDPGASTMMFQRFVDGRVPAAPGRPQRNRPVVLIAIAGSILVVLLAIVITVVLVGS